MSTPTLYDNASLARSRGARGLRLRLKPAHQSSGPVQGAWWPRTDQLLTELPLLLTALAPQFGHIDRVIFDETAWAPASLRMEFRGRGLILEGSKSGSTNTLTVIGERFGRLVLLVVPPYTNPAHAYTAVIRASKPNDLSSTDELLGIGEREARDRRLALLAHERWETDGGALRLRQERGTAATPAMR